MNRITQKEIARETGVSTAAVSMALRGLQGVSAATAERIRAVAAERGYVPDAAASMLSARRRRDSSGARQLSVAFLSGYPTAQPHFLRAAKAAGMVPHLFHCQDFDSPMQAARTLWARGIQGLCMDFTSAQSDWIDSVRCDPEWHRFSLVKQTRAHPDLPLYVVRHNAFDYMSQALQQVSSRGYRRIAVLLFASGSPADDDSRVGALLNHQLRHLPSGTTLTWRFCPELRPNPLAPEHLDWLHAQQPDVIISLYWSLLYSLLDAGWNIPGSIGFAAVLGIRHSDPSLPAVAHGDVQDILRAELTVRLLRELIQQGDTGLSAHPSELVIKPRWVEGETLHLIA